ncbi:hypothetical protein AAHA92_28404 [Salvia divinorum]|uniref:Uncharacterized protein n=1 Tax=Salvia divinorum TaxID=28513 RepID=A0ABD1FUZ2_SALDI
MGCTKIWLRDADELSYLLHKKVKAKDKINTDFKIMSKRKAETDSFSLDPIFVGKDDVMKDIAELFSESVEEGKHEFANEIEEDGENRDGHILSHSSLAVSSISFKLNSYCLVS